MIRASQPAILGLTFGDPWGVKTFSGLSVRLFEAIRDEGRLLAAVRIGPVRPWDALRGAVKISRGPRGYRLGLSRRWLWRLSTIETFSRRVDRRLAGFPEANGILQVGTHVYTRRPGLRQFCITDMTVAEAARAKMFHLSDLNARQLAEAEIAQQRIFSACDKIFVLSEWIRRSVIKDCGQPPEKVVAVGAGANTTPIEPAPGKYGSRNVLFVAWDWEPKGGPLLVEAMRIVRGSLPDATLTVIGAKPNLAEPGVIELGPLSKAIPAESEQLKRAYQNAACFCILPEFDAFPNVVLEAQYARTPVVSLNRQSRDEAVLDGQTGILVRDARPEPVAEALLSILSNPERAREMGQRGREFIAARFTWPVVAGRIINEIAQCLGTESVAPAQDQPAHVQANKEKAGVG